MSAYFAADGNYGDATNMVVVDTDNWTDEDWEIIDECLDDERPAKAEEIAKQRNG